MGRPNAFLLGAPRYQVSAACVVAKLSSGQESYVYRRGLMPASTLPSQLEHLLEQGMIEEVAS